MEKMYVKCLVSDAYFVTAPYAVNIFTTIWVAMVIFLVKMHLDAYNSWICLDRHKKLHMFISW